MPNFYFHIVTFGCKVNQYESHAIREAWQKRGGQETAYPDLADYILVNSCAITGRAERNARNAIQRLRRSAPNAQIILSGCAAQFYADFQPRKNAPWAMPDQIFNQNEKTRLLAGPGTVSPAQTRFAISSYLRGRPVIKIQDGCSHACSYCIVPQTRGRPVSRLPQDILAEAIELGASGYGELVLSGINLRQYSHGGGFWKLLVWLDRELESRFGRSLRLRISSLDPAMLDKEGIASLASCNLVCPHLHLSLQHASPAILRAMNRSHYSADGILDAITAIGWPVMGLGADILVGFPGETPEDLDLLISSIKNLPLTYAHVFPYSRRQGTPAASMSGQIAHSEKEIRARAVRDVVEEKRRQFLLLQLGQENMTLAPDAISGDKNTVKGVNEFYVSCSMQGPMHKGFHKGLLEVRPVQILKNGLLAVAPCATAAGI